MITNPQLKEIHAAARDVGLIDRTGDTSYRSLLLNVAGVKSAKALDQTTFEDCMAVLEDMGYSRDRRRHRDKASFSASGSAVGPQSTYWRDIVARRGSQANSRFVYKIKQLAAHQRYDLSAQCRKFSNGRTEFPEKLTPLEAWKLIEMLKASGQREKHATCPGCAGQITMPFAQSPTNRFA